MSFATAKAAPVGITGNLKRKESVRTRSRVSTTKTALPQTGRGSVTASPLPDNEASLHRYTKTLLENSGFAHTQFLHFGKGLVMPGKTAAMLRNMGAKNGAADFLIIVRGKAHWLELKNGKKGKLSDAQIKFREEAIRAGAEYAVASTQMEARTQLYLWAAINVLHDTVRAPADYSA